jgi:hypothetical protein
MKLPNTAILLIQNSSSGVSLMTRARVLVPSVIVSVIV